MAEGWSHIQHRSRLIIALLLIASLLLPGCFEVREEVWINEDRSGKILYQIGIDLPMYRMIQNRNQAPADPSLLTCDEEVLNTIRDRDVITNVECEEFQDTGMHITKTVVSARDITQLDQPIESASDNQKQNISIAETDEGYIRFHQVLDFTDQDQDAGSEDSAMAQDMIRSMFAGKHWTIKVHGPELVSTNGTVGESAKTASWKMPMLEMIQKNQRREVNATVSLGGFPWILSLALFFLIGFSGMALILATQDELDFPKAAVIGTLMVFVILAYGTYQIVSATVLADEVKIDTGSTVVLSNPSPSPSKTQTDRDGSEESRDAYRQSQRIFQNEAQQRRTRRQRQAFRHDIDEAQEETEREIQQNQEEFEEAIEEAREESQQEKKKLERRLRTYSTFSGKGTEQTSTFTVPSEWVVRWESRDAPNAFFAIYVYQNGEKTQTIGSHFGEATGTTKELPAGTYSLEVSYPGQWNIKVMEAK